MKHAATEASPALAFHAVTAFGPDAGPDAVALVRNSPAARQAARASSRILMAVLLSGRNRFDHHEADFVLRNLDAAVEADAPPLSRRLCRDRARLLLAGDARVVQLDTDRLSEDGIGPAIGDDDVDQRLVRASP